MNRVNGAIDTRVEKMLWSATLHCEPPHEDDLVRQWTFIPQANAWARQTKILRIYLTQGRRFPKNIALKSVSARAAWAVYFIYAPDGQLTSSHLFTLSRLRDAGFPIFVVFASRSPDLIPDTIYKFADAVHWKDLPGYDFSAYAIALDQLGTKSAGARLFLLNDSVFGPFCDIGKRVKDAPWALTGFTASSLLENHLQSYALIVREVTPQTLRDLWPVLSTSICLNRFMDVIYCQETRLAKVASRSMSVGSYWFAGNNHPIDLALARPIDLLNDGFPFLKRSFFTKYRTRVPLELLRERMALMHHPIEPYMR